MSPTLVLCASVALLAAPAGCSRGDPSPAPTSNASASTRGTHAMTLLSDESLQACREPGVAVVLARVTKAEIDNPGTRSEMAILDLAVERTLCGEVPPAVSVWRYTSRGDTVLREKERYVVVCAKRNGPVDHSLGEFVPVPAGRETEVVEAHLAALKRLSAQGK